MRTSVQESASFLPQYLWHIDTLQSNEAILYSRLKLGDKRVAQELAQSLLDKNPVVRRMVRDYKPLIVSTPIIGEKPINAAYLLGDALSGLTGCMHMEALEKQKRKSGVLYYRLSPQERIALTDQEVEVTSPKTIRGKSVLLVDDCMATGAMFEVCKNKLEQAGTSYILPVTIVYLDKERYKDEKTLDYTSIFPNRTKNLTEIIQDPQDMITTRLITLLQELSPNELDEIMSSLDPKKRKEIEQAIKIMTQTNIHASVLNTH